MFIIEQKFKFPMFFGTSEMQHVYVSSSESWPKEEEKNPKMTLFTDWKMESKHTSLKETKVTKCIWDL